MSAAVPMPDVLSAIRSTPAGVFANGYGDFIVEPVMDADGMAELILVRADGSTATLRGEWETGFEA